MRKSTAAAVALVAVTGIAMTGGCAGMGKGSATGGTGTGKAGDVEYGRGTGSHTGVGTMDAEPKRPAVTLRHPRQQAGAAPVAQRQGQVQEPVPEAQSNLVPVTKGLSARKRASLRMQLGLARRMARRMARRVALREAHSAVIRAALPLPEAPGPIRAPTSDKSGD